MEEEISNAEQPSVFSCIASRSAFIFTSLLFLFIVLSGASEALANAEELPSSPISCIVPEAGAPSCGTETSPGSTPIDQAMPQHVGNPINVVTGNKYQYELDYRAVNSGLALARHYNSSLTDFDNGFGPGWRHTYHVVLTRVSDSQVDVVQSDGRLIHFYREANETNLYRAQLASDGFIETGERSVWHLNDGRRMLFQGSFLVLIDMGDKLGKLRLAYSNKMLRSVTDLKGDAILFDYFPPSDVLPTYGAKAPTNPAGSISAVTLPNGHVIQYAYAEHRNLSNVIYAQDNTIKYQYLNDSWSSHLTGRASTADSRNSQWTYDDDGKAIGWQDGTGNNGLNITRSTPSLNGKPANELGNDSTQAVVSYADGRKTNYSWNKNQHTQNFGSTTLDVNCDNCLPQKPSNQAEPIEQQIQSPQDVSMDALWSSLERIPLDGNEREGITRYKGEYPHKDGSVSIQLSTDRTGKVKDFSINDMTLETIVKQARQDNVAECVEGTHFESTDTFSHDRIQRLGTGDEACSLDSAVAVELIYRLEKSNSTNTEDGVLNKSTDSDATPSVPWYHDMRRYCHMPAGISCSDLAHDLRMAQLSECAYGNVSCEPEFTLVDYEDFGIDDLRFNNQGFNSQLYYDAQEDQYVLAFRGTDEIGDDWDANFGQARGERTRQYDLAVNLAIDVSGRLPEEDLVFTGHSLGGGLATIAALQTNRTATVFNTAALQPTTAALHGLTNEYQNANENIRHIHTDFDPVTVLQERADDLDWGDLQTAPGEQLEIPNPDHPWMNATHASATTFSQGFFPILWHKISAVKHVLQSLIDYNCPS